MRRDNPTAASTNAPGHDDSRRVIFFEAAFGCSAPLFFAVTYTNSLAIFLVRLKMTLQKAVQWMSLGATYYGNFLDAGPKLTSPLR